MKRIVLGTELYHTLKRIKKSVYVQYIRLYHTIPVGPFRTDYAGESMDAHKLIMSGAAALAGAHRGWFCFRADVLVARITSARSGAVVGISESGAFYEFRGALGLVMKPESKTRAGNMRRSIVPVPDESQKRIMSRSSSVVWKR